MSAPSKLEQAVEQVYGAFSHEKPQAEPDHRPQRGRGSPGDSFSSTKPLRAMTDEEIGRYATAAINDAGSAGAGAYRYYLPRIVELATSSALWAGAEPQAIADKLSAIGWGESAEDESAAVVALFREGFLHALEVHPDEGRAAAGWLYAVARAAGDVAPLLAHWRFVACANSVLHLADFVRFNARRARYEEYDLVGYWQAISRRQRYEIASWLLEQSTREQLERALQQIASTEVWRLEAAISDLP